MSALATNQVQMRPKILTGSPKKNAAWRSFSNMKLGSRPGVVSRCHETNTPTRSNSCQRRRCFIAGTIVGDGDNGDESGLRRHDHTSRAARRHHRTFLRRRDRLAGDGAPARRPAGDRDALRPALGRHPDAGACRGARQPRPRLERLLALGGAEGAHRAPLRRGPRRRRRARAGAAHRRRERRA